MGGGEFCISKTSLFCGEGHVSQVLIMIWDLLITMQYIFLL